MMKKVVHIAIVSLFIIVIFSSIKSQASATHLPIRINGNIDFSEYATKGDGSYNNPWIIENLNIDGSDTRYCIFIGNTTDYFIVMNCNLHDAELFRYRIDFIEGSGIQLYNVTNGNISKNVVIGNGWGIYLNYSDGNKISENNISNNVDGIHISSGSDNILIYNSVQSNEDNGIRIGQSDNIKISDNYFLNNRYESIHLENSNTTTISNNHGQSVNLLNCNSNFIINNSLSGITLQACLNINIKNNNLSTGGIGIYGDNVENWNTHSIDSTNLRNERPIYYWINQNGGTIPLGVSQIILANCTNVIIKNQDVSSSNHSGFGISVAFSTKIIVENNIASYNSYGIHIQNSSNNVIQNNTISHTYDGIQVIGSNNNIINGNIVDNNNEGIGLTDSNGNTIVNNMGSSNWAAIYLHSSSYNNISYNTASNSLRNNGILIQWSSDYNMLYKNTILDNFEGIAIWGSSNNLVSNNMVSNTISSNDSELYSSIGIFIFYDENTTVRENTVISTERGIYNWNSNYTLISENHVSKNIYYGVGLRTSENITIVNNDISSNVKGVYLNYSKNITLSNNVLNYNECDVLLQDSTIKTSNGLISDTYYVESYSKYYIGILTLVIIISLMIVLISNKRKKEPEYKM
ncbi:MAG: right-handed parallel beta-helix repeat-containing protein [Euryarchaeota archaeon]|nr:right-handed parallel beta-helix repeat-containing protein [Euryarchaeota archaeon]